jgi:hypothetical protein
MIEQDADGGCGLIVGVLRDDRVHDAFDEILARMRRQLVAGEEDLMLAGGRDQGTCDRAIA